ncbi:MAG: glycine cleavage system protein GcvH [Thermoplasmata archaeon]|nr:MAG: glycine cleavage system protein GcvH [Thermoplasmata archaeon]
MAEIREGLLYTETHEWVLKKNGIARIGITDYAQQHLTDVVYVELPEVGKVFKKGDEIATIESVKSVSEVYAPISGEITAINERLENEPELINQSPYDDGWLFEMKMENEGELNSLLSPSAYKKILD